MNKHPQPRLLPLLFALALGGACTEGDPDETNIGADTSADTSADAGADTGAGEDATADASADSGRDTDLSACTPLATDYAPGADDQWDACISDDNTYHRFQESISSIGRIGGFEEIADLLWRNDALSAEDFISARDVYATGEGLDSRVQRREDEHYPPVTDPESGEALRCRDEGVPAMAPQRCVGPALILPILNEAFQAGITGQDLEANAARIEAALLWFIYVSTHKEATTCAQAAKDCDSAYAYYTGAAPREGGLGLSGYLRSVAPAAHERVWDALLGLRCWRDLDDTEEAQDLAMRDLAIAQLDTALLHGLTQLVVDRLIQWQRAEGADKAAHAAFLSILGPVLDREASLRDASRAPLIAAAWSDLESADIPELISALDAVFPCP